MYFQADLEVHWECAWRLSQWDDSPADTTMKALRHIDGLPFHKAVYYSVARFSFN